MDSAAFYVHPMRGRVKAFTAVSLLGWIYYVAKATAASLFKKKREKKTKLSVGWCRKCWDFFFFFLLLVIIGAEDVSVYFSLGFVEVEGKWKSLNNFEDGRVGLDCFYDFPSHYHIGLLTCCWKSYEPMNLSRAAVVEVSFFFILFLHLD